MELPIKIAEKLPGIHVELDAYDDLEDRCISITQITSSPIPNESVSIDYEDIDALIAALEQLKQGFETGWNNVERQEA